MTGRLRPSAAGVQTFRKRQSSAYAGSLARPLPGCIEGAPNCSASRTPVHGCRGGAALKRFAPDTDPAYGMPLNLTRPSPCAPRTRPYAVSASTYEGLEEEGRE